MTNSLYYELTPDNLFSYIKTIPSLSSLVEEDSLVIRDISNGINAVYWVESQKNVPFSCIVKQALPYFRQFGEEERISKNRLLAEIEAYALVEKQTPTLTPHVLFADKEMFVIILEAIDNHILLNTAFQDGIILPHLSEHLATFLTKNFYETSSLYLDSEAKRYLLGKFNTNSEVCALTEKYVFTERNVHYLNLIHKKETLASPLLDEKDVTISRIMSAILTLKYKFMTQNDGIVHGDFRGGAVLVNEESTKVIDYEFAFMGPLGYDLGSILYTAIACFVSHRIFHSSYQEWLLEFIESLFTSFEVQLLALWDINRSSSLIDPCVNFGQGVEFFRQKFIKEIFADSFGFCAVQMGAMMVPLALVKKNITSEEFLRNEEQFYLTMERISTILLQEYPHITNISDVIKILRNF